MINNENEENKEEEIYSLITKLKNIIYPEETESIDPLEEMVDVETESLAEELSKFLFTPENIQMKTEYANPHAITGLQLYAKKLGNTGFEGSEEALSFYRIELSKNMVSKDRKGREEGKEIAISSFQREEQPNLIADKMKEEE